MKLVLLLAVGVALGLTLARTERPSARRWLLVACVAGCALVTTGIQVSDAVVNVVFVVLGFLQYLVAVLLACHLIKPSKWWGYSPVGQVLQGTAWLWLGRSMVGPSTFGESLPLVLACVPAVLLVLGFHAEAQARVRHATA